MAAGRDKEPAKTPRDISRVLWPGRKVLLEGGTITVRVYPPGLRHQERFTQALAGAFGVMAGMRKDAGASLDNAAVGRLMVTQLVPFVLRHMVEIVEDCVVFEGAAEGLTLSELPHYHLPPIIEAWCAESFGDEAKWRPWMETIERLVEKSTGRKGSLSSMLSSFSSLRATVEATS